MQLYSYENPVFVNHISTRSDYNKNPYLFKSLASLQRSKNNLFITVSANLTKFTKFITMTTKETVLDRKDFLMHFNQFRKNFTRIFGYNLKYVAVLERQKLRGKKENNLGSWHIHMIVFNDEKLNFLKLKKAWSIGSVDIKRLSKNSQVPIYLMKYLSKENILINDKAIFKSHHLKQPTIYYDVSKLELNDFDYKTSYSVYDGSKVTFYEKHLYKPYQAPIKSIEF
jgi:hypothetical protein